MWVKTIMHMKMVLIRWGSARLRFHLDGVGSTRVVSPQPSGARMGLSRVGSKMRQAEKRDQKTMMAPVTAWEDCMLILR